MRSSWRATFNGRRLPARCRRQTPTTSGTRPRAARARRELRGVFSVDVLGEGVDVPTSTRSCCSGRPSPRRVFAQQLGRGLRLATTSGTSRSSTSSGSSTGTSASRSVCGRLSTTGKARSVTRPRRAFPSCRPGARWCSTAAREDRPRRPTRAATLNRSGAPLVEELKATGDVELGVPGRMRTGRRISDLYRQPDRSWTRLRRDAGLPTRPGASPESRSFSARFAGSIHIDDPERTAFYIDVLGAATPPRPDGLERSPTADARHAARRPGAWAEGSGPSEPRSMRCGRTLPSGRSLRNFLALGDRSSRLVGPLDLDPEAPLALHASVRPGRGPGRAGRRAPVQLSARPRGRPLRRAVERRIRCSSPCESPSARSRPPRCIATTRSHPTSSTGSRRARCGPARPRLSAVPDHASQGSHVLLFVRDRARSSSGGTQPYTCLRSSDLRGASR